jgi:hypothetical protein
MGYYKFLHSKDIHHVAAGETIRLSTLSHYRELEGGEQWIADHLEGAVAVGIRDLALEGQGGFSAYTPEGFGSPIGGSASVKNCLFLYICPEAYIFCASQGNLASLTEVMCDNATAAPYDACLRISDMRVLAHRIYHRGTVLEMDGARVRDLLGYPVCDTVTYSDLFFEQTSGMTRPLAPSPFRKHSTFDRQREVRIVFERASQAILPESITIRVPELKQLFVQEFSDRPTGRSLSAAPPLDDVDRRMREYGPWAGSHAEGRTAAATAPTEEGLPPNHSKAS